MTTQSIKLTQAPVLVGTGKMHIQAISTPIVANNDGSMVGTSVTAGEPWFYEGTDGVYLRSYEGEAYAIVSGDSVIGGSPPSPAPPLKTPLGGITLSAGQEATMADIEALIPSGKVTSITFVAIPNKDGLGGMTIVGGIGDPLYYPAPSSASFGVDELARHQLGDAKISCDNVVGASVNISFTGTAS
jgi:hypothetical protein